MIFVDIFRRLRRTDVIRVSGDVDIKHIFGTSSNDTPETRTFILRLSLRSWQVR